MELAMCRQQNADKKQTNRRVAMVGMTPERSKVAGRFNMAGPVKEFTAIDMLPRYPMEPVLVIRKRQYLRRIIRHKTADWGFLSYLYAY